MAYVWQYGGYLKHAIASNQDFYKLNSQIVNNNRSMEKHIATMERLLSQLKEYRKIDIKKTSDRRMSGKTKYVTDSDELYIKTGPYKAIKKVYEAIEKEHENVRTLYTKCKQLYKSLGEPQNSAGINSRDIANKSNSIMDDAYKIVVKVFHDAPYNAVMGSASGLDISIPHSIY